LPFVGAKAAAARFGAPDPGAGQARQKRIFGFFRGRSQ
jgi:hypothetical protein